MQQASTARKPPPRVTPAFLQRVAMRYLERYSAPAEQLRRVLARRVSRSCRHHGDDPHDFAAMVETVVARCVESGPVDDVRFAEGRAATLRRRGHSARSIAARLQAKGVSGEVAARIGPVSDEDEISAARIAARRKRLGPWSRARNPDSRSRDIAVLVRAGFGFAVARAVIDAEDEAGALHAGEAEPA